MAASVFNMGISKRSLFTICLLYSLLISSEVGLTRDAGDNGHNVQSHPHDDDVLETVSHESHLYFHLLDDHHYVRHLRPAASNNDTIFVSLNVIVTGITDLDEGSQELGASLMLMGLWRDYRLSWNVSDYGGITSLVVPAAQIWKPDFSLLHTMYGSFDHFTNEVATVTSDGEVSLTWHYKAKSRCPVDLTNFPFDTHTCHVTLVDASYAANQIRFKFMASDHLTDQSHVTISVSSQWEVSSSTVKKTIGRLLHPEVMDYISVSVRLQRKSQFYHCVIVGPVVMIAILVPVIFLMPVDTSGKTTLGGCILIALLLSLKLFCEVIGPNRSAAPRIAIFHVASMALCSLSIIMAAIITSTARRRNARKPVPTWISRIFLGRCGMRRWLCMEPYSNVDHTTTFASMKTAAEFHEQESDVTPLKDGETDLKEVSRTLRTLVGRYSADQTTKDIDSDWREIAMVIDRLLLLFFSLVFLLTAVSMIS